MRSHRSSVALLSALTFTTLLLGAAPAARAATPYCGITWGSLAKFSPTGTQAPVVGARVGRQDCYDRLVIDLGGTPAAGYNVRYTDGFRSAGGGSTPAVSGGAILTATVFAPDFDASGRRTVSWSVGTHIVTPQQFTSGGFRTFRDLVYGGNYEGAETAFGLGVRARLPFRAFTLDGPNGGSRLVIDVAHQW
jgi:hypothetical protein